jgi:Tfp pilus assembly protein PilF
MTTPSPLRGSPAELNALGALAQREYRAGRLAEAAEAFRKILAIRPEVAEVHNDLAVILALDGKLDLAAAQFEGAIALKPSLPDVYFNLGKVLNDLGRFDEAAARFEQAIALRPDHVEAYNNLGVVLRNQRKLGEAVARFEQAIALRPDYAEAIHNLGNTLWKQDKFEEAAARFEQVLTLKPDYAEAHNSLGIMLAQQGELERAGKRFEQAIAVRPGYAEAQVGMATCYLLQEDYARGWPAYEARLRLPGVPRQPNLPRWAGEPLAGRTLLLVAEQGLGDTLFFLRYARAFRARGARVVLAAQAALGRLLASHPDLDELLILGSGADLSRADFYLPLQSAPGALATNAATIPTEIPYLSADPELAQKWREDLSNVDGFKIGIVWQGSRGYLLDRWRSIPLAEFAPLAGLPGVRLISLQKGFGSKQITDVDFPVRDLSSQLDESTGPFMDTAALIRNLDLVVTPDSATAHLAGALGAPVWLALQHVPDWRWLRDRDDSPWYPNARLFRQTTFGEWSEVFQRMAKTVQALRSEAASSALNRPFQPAVGEGQG